MFRWATVLRTGDQGNIAAGIEAGDQLFNVNFEYGSATEIYSLGFDVDNVDAAEVVKNAINQALNDVVLDEITLVGTALNDLEGFAIGFSSGAGDDVNVVLGFYNGFDWINDGTTTRNPGDPLVYATFTAVPEPGTALMLGLGLAALGARGRPREWEERKARV